MNHDERQDAATVCHRLHTAAVEAIRSPSFTTFVKFFPGPLPSKTNPNQESITQVARNWTRRSWPPTAEARHKAVL